MKYVTLIATALSVAVPATAQLVDQGLVRMSKAIATAERHLSAQAIEADLETRGGRLVYEIDLLRGSTVNRAVVDAHSDKVVAVEKPRADDDSTRSWLEFGRLTRGAKVSLAQRLSQLEQRVGGEVKDVEFEVEKGHPFYDIEVATAKGLRKIRMDATSGRILRMVHDR